MKYLKTYEEKYNSTFLDNIKVELEKHGWVEIKENGKNLTFNVSHVENIVSTDGKIWLTIGTKQGRKFDIEIFVIGDEIKTIIKYAEITANNYSWWNSFISQNISNINENIISSFSKKFNI
jgi:hypothetical protein